MSALLGIAWRSAWHRRFALALVVGSLALSTFLLLSVERIRADVQRNFRNAVSGTDLIVGARSGPVPLLLYSVFRIGGVQQGVRLSSLQALEQDRAVAWVVPLALGDSHQGFPVLGTTVGYFEHFRYGDRRPLALAEGRAFEATTDREAVLGAEVAERLGYRPGQRIVLSHGDGALDGQDHDHHPFTVVGVLARTGTPVDRSVHITLQGMQALHQDWVGGIRLPGAGGALGAAVGAPLRAPGVAEPALPRTVTAALVGLKSRAAVFSVQQRVATQEGEPLMAILPGVVLDELWSMLGMVEQALLAMSALVGAVSLAGLIAVVVAALDQRRRELAVLRSIGAGPPKLLGLLVLEGAVLSGVGVLLGTVAWWGLLAMAGPWVEAHHGVVLSAGPPRSGEWALIAAVVAAGPLAALLPGWRAYRLSLADGLQVRG